MNTTIKGAAKSITVWVGGLLVVLGQLTPLLSEDTFVALGLHDRSLKLALTISGLLMLACRTITKNSLADKGAAPVSQPTPENPK